MEVGGVWWFGEALGLKSWLILSDRLDRLVETGHQSKNHSYDLRHTMIRQQSILFNYLPHPTTSL